MAERYEMSYLPDVELVGPGTQLGEDRIADGEYALVIGDPNSSALVVCGPPDSLRRWATIVANMVKSL